VGDKYATWSSTKTTMSFDNGVVLGQVPLTYRYQMWPIVEMRSLI